MKVACSPACVWFCTLLVFLCVVLSTYLFWVIKYVYVGLHTMYVWVCVEPLYQLAYILIGSFWENNGLSHFRGVICSLAIHNPKNVCTWEIPLSIDITRLSSLYVVCHSHEKFRFYMFMNYLLLAFICLLLKRNGLSHYGGVISYVHITILENVNIWGNAT